MPKRSLSIFLALLFVASFASAQRAPSRPGTGNPDEPLVPWLFLETETELPKGAVMVVWLPSSNVEMSKSDLRTSPSLVEDAARCVSMQVVPPANSKLRASLNPGAQFPAVLLIDRDGRTLRRVDARAGRLRAAEVQQMVVAELGARDDRVYGEMSEAAHRVAAHEDAAAIELYREVWEERCLFPLAATQAQRALKTLGVVVQEPPPVALPDPNLAIGLPSKPRDASPKPPPDGPRH